MSKIRRTEKRRPGQFSDMRTNPGRRSALRISLYLLYALRYTVVAFYIESKIINSSDYCHNALTFNFERSSNRNLCTCLASFIYNFYKTGICISLTGNAPFTITNFFHALTSFSKSTACLTVYVNCIAPGTTCPQPQLRSHSAETQQIFARFYRQNKTKRL